MAKLYAFQEFFDRPSANVDREDFLNDLQRAFAKLRSPPTIHHSKPSVFVHNNLAACTHVFIRIDAVKRSLQRPYEGPYKVIDRDTKHIDVLVAGKKQRISIDRVKPAFICNESISDHPCDENRTVVTQSGHRVRFLA